MSEDRTAQYPGQDHVDQAIVSRRSVRAFLPTAVPREVIEELLSVARRAPSSTNIQPWKVYALTGEAKQSLSRRVLAADDDGQWREDTVEFPYHPTSWTSPYIERRRKVGWDLYGLLGIKRDDKAGRRAQGRRNFVFFDAPVALIFTMDRVMQAGSLLDYGMFLQSIMIAARGRGLDTCPQAAFSGFHEVIAAHLDLHATERYVCAMALGYADQDALVNTLKTEREEVRNFTVFVD